MISISRFTAIVAVAAAAAAIASPSFAQSFDPEFGTSNTLPFAFPATAQHTTQAAPRAHVRVQAVAPRSGLNAFALVPQGSYSPSATGGGSIGYNEGLRTNQW